MSRPVTTGEFAEFRVWLADRLNGLEQRVSQPPLLASTCQKCGLVAGVVIGYVDEVNGVRIGRAAWCCPRCVNRALERIEQLEAQAGRNPAAHDQEKPR